MRRRKNFKKKIFITTIISIILWIIIIYILNTYPNIEIYEPTYEASKTKSTVDEQTVENVEEKSKNVADVIEETVKCVVGISKLKNAGTSIFSSNT